MSNLGGFTELIEKFESKIAVKKIDEGQVSKPADITNGFQENKEVSIDDKKNSKKRSNKTEKKKCKKEIKSLEEETYNIESLVKKKGSKYLVKWENFDEKFNTWEPTASIPQFILKVCIVSCLVMAYDEIILCFSFMKMIHQGSELQHHKLWRWGLSTCVSNLLTSNYISGCSG